MISIANDDGKTEFLHKEVKSIKNKVLESKLTYTERKRLQRMLRDLENAKKGGTITGHAFWKSRQRINKKLMHSD